MRISTSILANVRLVLFLGIAGILVSSPARAATVTTATNPSQTFFAASTTDLINAGMSTLAGATHTGYAGSNIGALNDGVVGGVTDFPSIAFDADGTWTSTYDLNLTNAPDGYDLTEVRTIAAWLANRASQQYELSVSTVGDSSFTSLGSFGIGNASDGASQITLTDSTGVLAHGVDAVRFSVQPRESNAETAFREFDVFGNATVTVVPEPETYALMLAGLGLSTLVACRRKRKAA